MLRSNLFPMIPLDPEEIIASGCGESLRRVALALGALLLGSICALMASQTASLFLAALDFLLRGRRPSLATPFDDPMYLFLLPVWAFATMTFIVAIPNLFVALIYFARTEEPTALRFLIHAFIHQVATAVTIQIWDGGNFSGPLETFIAIAALVVCQLIAGFFLFSLVQIVKSRFRVDHEVHLMTVAAQNDAKRRALATKVHIPPPPKGTEPPKARGLKETAPKSSEK